MIRSPAFRFKLETLPLEYGLPSDEDVGKSNMRTYTDTAKMLCRDFSISHQGFGFLHSPNKTFLFGDGPLDWLTNSLSLVRISGRALLPLTPHLCVYFNSSASGSRSVQCASLMAPGWMVDWINHLPQMYSRDSVFFLGTPPKLSVEFKQQYLCHEDGNDLVLDTLDRVLQLGNMAHLRRTPAGPQD